MYSQRIVDCIRDANPTRSITCLRRRLMKLLEELGEGCEAYLSTTGSTNYKQKTWADYREEACDIMIVMIDVALTELPDSKWPPQSFLHIQIDEGKSEAPMSFDTMEDVKFEIARNICSADHFLRQRDGDMGFYGAAGRGVKAAAKLCFAKVPGNDTSNINDEVFSTIQRKLEKWKGRSTATTPTTLPKVKLVKPYTTDAIDAKDFLDDVRDRNENH